MQTIIKILSFTFHAILWVLVIAIVSYLVWGLLTKPKWRKNAANAWHNISKWIVQKVNNQKTKMDTKEEGIKNVSPAPVMVYSPPPPPRSEQPSNHQLDTIVKELESIVRQLEQLNGIVHQLDFLSTQIERLEENLDQLQKQSKTTVPTKTIQPQKKIWRTYYVSAPSMINPVRFRPEDLSDHPGGNFFSIEALDGESGEMDVVSDPDTAEKLLSTLAFQKNIVEVAENTKGSATAICVLEKGKLVWEDGLWLLKERIKIKII